MAASTMRRSGQQPFEPQRPTERPERFAEETAKTCGNVGAEEGGEHTRATEDVQFEWGFR